MNSVLLLFWLLLLLLFQVLIYQFMIIFCHVKVNKWIRYLISYWAYQKVQLLYAEIPKEKPYMLFSWLKKIVRQDLTSRRDWQLTQMTGKTVFNRSLFHIKITAIVTKSSHQDRDPCYLHVPIFLFYIHSPLLQQNKKLLPLLQRNKKLLRSLFSLAN